MLLNYEVNNGLFIYVFNETDWLKGGLGALLVRIFVFLNTYLSSSLLV